MIECLTCQHENLDTELLCTECGAPLPDKQIAKPNPEKRHRLHKRSRTPWVIALAIGALSLALVAFLSQDRAPSTAQSLTQDLPAGAVMAGGGNLAAIRNHPNIKKWLDFPATQLVLNLVKNQAGIDIMALKSAVGGIYAINEKAHILAVIIGRFNAEPLARWLSGQEAEEIQIAGHSFWSSTAFADKLGKNMAPLVIGVVDGKRLIVGSLELVEGHLKGAEGSEESSELGDLLARIDKRAVAWGAGRLKEGLESLWWVAAPLLGPDPSDKLANLKFIYTVHLDRAFKLQLTVICPSESVAQQVVAVLEDNEIEPTLWTQEEGLTLKVAQNGNEVTGTLSIALPSLPTP